MTKPTRQLQTTPTKRHTAMATNQNEQIKKMESQ